MSASSQDKIRRILIAIDTSGYKNKIVSTAFDIAKGLGAEIFAIHVVDRTAMGAAGNMQAYYRGGSEAYKQELKKQRQPLVNEVRDYGASIGVKVTPEVVTNDSAASEIIDYAKSHDIQLIVIGTKDMSGIERFLMGSVANHVISHAHCPVLAIR